MSPSAHALRKAGFSVVAISVAASAAWLLCPSPPQSNDEIAYRVAVQTLRKRYGSYQACPFYLLPKTPSAVYQTTDYRGRLLLGVRGELETDWERTPPRLVRSLLRPLGVIGQPPIRERWYVYLRHEADGSWSEDHVQVGEATVHVGAWGEATAPPKTVSKQ